MDSPILLYDKDNIGGIVWPNSERGTFAKQYLLPLMRQGVNYYIDNIKTELYILKVDDQIIPVTVNSAEWENSYVCSPYTHYVTYLLEEIPKLENKKSVAFLSFLVANIGKILRNVKFNKVVIVNNWLFSTNIYPELSSIQIQAINDKVLAHFPDHAILYKSVDSYRSTKLLRALQALGGCAIGSRKVYFWNPALPETKTQHARKYFRGDRSVRRDSNYLLSKIEVEDAVNSGRLRELYQYLYLDKYSYYNPQYNEHFFKLAMETGFLSCYQLQADRIDGVIAFYRLSGMLVSPIVGYDTAVHKERGLYRLLLLQATDLARQEGLIFHASSGVGEFKKNRGCIGALEYTVVFTKHLSFSRRLVWLSFSYVVNKIGIPILMKYEL